VAATPKYPVELRERAVRLYNESDPKPVIAQLFPAEQIRRRAMRQRHSRDGRAGGTRRTLARRVRSSLARQTAPPPTGYPPTRGRRSQIEKSPGNRGNLCGPARRSLACGWPTRLRPVCWTWISSGGVVHPKRQWPDKPPKTPGSEQAIAIPRDLALLLSASVKAYRESSRVTNGQVPARGSSSGRSATPATRSTDGLRSSASTSATTWLCC
jgi:hypothetical protein